MDDRAVVQRASDQDFTTVLWRFCGHRTKTNPKTFLFNIWLDSKEAKEEDWWCFSVHTYPTVATGQLDMLQKFAQPWATGRRRTLLQPGKQGYLLV